MKRFLLLALVVSCVDALRADAPRPCSPTRLQTLHASLLGQAPGLRPEVLRLALDAAGCAAERGLVKRREMLTVIDYSLPSSEPRLFVFDLVARKLLYRELVAHGKNSGGDQASHFSNSPGSLATSLGLFVTADTYFGSNGYSLRLKGLEENINDMAFDRAIVMHGAHYVSKIAVRVLGRLGRSWGCPAVRSEIAEEIIDKLRGGTPIFAYYPDKAWLKTSEFIPASRTSSGS